MRKKIKKEKVRKEKITNMFNNAEISIVIPIFSYFLISHFYPQYIARTCKF